jgi:large subunit ribosomal protein L29
MKATELRKKDRKELERQVTELRHKMDDLRFQLAAKSLKNVKELHETKRDIARILTIIKESEKN